MKLLLRLKGGAGSGHHGHVGRQGKRGGSIPGLSITMSGGTSDAEFADMILNVLDDKNLEQVYPITITNSDTGQEINAHIVQNSVGGRIYMSQATTEYGKPYQKFTSLSSKGKSKGKLRFESSDPQWLLEERGLSKESGYFHK